MRYSRPVVTEIETPGQAVFAIFVETICDGLVPLWYRDDGFPVTYRTVREAQLEIADDLIMRLQQFVEGERGFEDAATVEELVLPVDLLPDGSIVTEDGLCFGQRS